MKNKPPVIYQVLFFAAGFTLDLSLGAPLWFASLGGVMSVAALWFGYYLLGEDDANCK